MGRRFLSAVVVAVALMLVATGCLGGESGTKAGASLVRGFFAGARNEGELAAILGGSATRSELRDAMAAWRSAMKVGIAAVPKAADQASGFLDDVEAGGAGIIALIGHNDGSAIVFADGSRAPLSVIAAANSKAKVVVVSCGDALTVNGETVADAGQLQWSVGVDTLRRFSESVAASGRKPAQMTVAETKQLVAQAYTDAKRADRNAVAIKATIGVTGGVVSITIYTTAT